MYKASRSLSFCLYLLSWGRDGYQLFPSVLDSLNPGVTNSPEGSMPGTTIACHPLRQGHVNRRVAAHALKISFMDPCNSMHRRLFWALAYWLMMPRNRWWDTNFIVSWQLPAMVLRLFSTKVSGSVQQTRTSKCSFDRKLGRAWHIYWGLHRNEVEKWWSRYLVTMVYAIFTDDIFYPAFMVVFHASNYDINVSLLLNVIAICWKILCMKTLWNKL